MHSDKPIVRITQKMQKAFDACGHYDWVKCYKCKHWSHPREMWQNTRGYLHPLCKHLGAQRITRDPEIYGLD